MRQRGSHRAGTFSAIKAAGIRLIYEHGYEAMTLRMLAHSVGLESGSLYYHIKDKQDFLFRLLKEIIEGNIATLDERLRGVEDPEDRLRVLICFFITHQWEKKEEAFIISSEVRSLTPENYQVISALGARLSGSGRRDHQERGCGRKIPGQERHRRRDCRVRHPGRARAMVLSQGIAGAR